MPGVTPVCNGVLSVGGCSEEGTRVSDEMCDWHANTQFYLWGIEREARPSVHHHHPPLTTGLLIKAPSVHTRAQASEHTHLHTHIYIEMYTHSATQTIKKEGGREKNNEAGLYTQQPTFCGRVLF